MNYIIYTYLILLIYLFNQILCQQLHNSQQYLHHHIHHLHHSCDVCHLNKLKNISNHNDNIININEHRNNIINSFHNYKNNPLVDVFFIISKGEEEYSYIKSDEFWLSLLLLKSYSHNNDTRIHLVTDIQHILDHIKLIGFPFFGHDLREYQKENDEFMAMYKPNHHSINSIEYEYLCFYRWHVFRYVIINWNITHPNEKSMKRIMTLDLDVIFFQNAAEFFNNIVESLTIPNNNHNSDTNHINNNHYDNFELIVITNGAIHLWTPHGIIAYSDFIYEWYNKTDPDLVTEETMKVAGYLYKVLHFSDMQMVDAFSNSLIKKGKDNLNQCYIEGSTKGFWSRPNNHQCLLDVLGCVPVGRFNDFMANTTFSFINGTLWGSEEKIPYCLMHLQGSAKSLFKLFALSLYNSRYTKDDHTLDNALDLKLKFQKPLLVGEQGPRPHTIYYIDEEGSRHVIPSWDVFMAMNFDGDDIIKSVPKAFVQVFPLGEDIHEKIK